MVKQMWFLDTKKWHTSLDLNSHPEKFDRFLLSNNKYDLIRSDICEESFWRCVKLNFHNVILDNKKQYLRTYKPPKCQNWNIEHHLIVFLTIWGHMLREGITGQPLKVVDVSLFVVWWNGGPFHIFVSEDG